MHLPEELGAMEVRVLRLDGVPTDEMRHGQAVAALIDIARRLQATEAFELMLEECRNGHKKG